MKSKFGSKTNEVIETVNSGKFDKKGREIGLKIKTWEAEFVPIDENTVICNEMEPGYYFAVNIHTTKNGARFGAIQPCKYFLSIAERSSYIEKRKKTAKK